LLNKLLPCCAKSLDEGRKAAWVLRAEHGQVVRGVPRYWFASTLALASAQLQNVTVDVGLLTYMNSFKISLELFLGSAMD
jgi:hypothetical protein